MKHAAHLHQNAGWRSDASRLRSFALGSIENLCSTVIGNAYGMKIAATTTVAAFPVIRPTRRGAPPQ